MLTVTRHVITLRLTRPTNFHFLHGGVLNALVCHGLETHPLPRGVIPVACEQGHVQYSSGDRYNFGVTFVADEAHLKDKLLRGLESLGARAPRLREQGGPPTLGGNYRVERVRDLVPPDIDAEVRRLATRQGRIELRFLSPLRMKRPKPLQIPGQAYFNDSCFPADVFLTRLWRRVESARAGRDITEQEADRQKPPLALSVVADPSGLIWLDLPIAGELSQRPERPAGFTLGGVVGRVIFEGIPSEWLEALVLGQYLHVGENIAFGLGRYDIVSPHSDVGETGPVDVGDRWGKKSELSDSQTPRNFQPARSILARAMEADRLAAALATVTESGSAPGVDGVEAVTIQEQSREVVDSLYAELADGRYTPSPLRGIATPKPNGGTRMLAIPTFRDRIAQRAVYEVLRPSLETLFEDSSFAYRRGLSRKAAAIAIRQAYRDGYRWVLDADIEAFFDSVEWSLILARLEALFPDEPVLGIVARWIQAPIQFGYRVVERERGIPQGAVISPLLANLFLDQLDERVLGENFRLVRYADDFVVLCRDLEEARRAQQHVQAELADLGLKLNVAKTDIRSFEDGFSYLGYLFCRASFVEHDLDRASASWTAPGSIGVAGKESPRSNLTGGDSRATDVKSPVANAALAPTARDDHGRGDQTPTTPAVADDNLNPIPTPPPVVGDNSDPMPTTPAMDESTPAPRQAWLAGVHLENAREASPPVKPLIHSVATPAATTAPLSIRSPARRAAYITDTSARLRLSEEKLIVERPGEPVREIPIRQLSHVVFLGAVRATLPLLTTMSRLGVPSYFCRRSGQLYAEFSRHQPNWPLWERQSKLAESEETRASFSRLLVGAKLHNTTRLATRHKLQGWGSIGEQIRDLIKACDAESTVETLRGLEGRGAALFFEALRASLPAEWGFTVRRRRPAPDPVNAMLSLTYTALYNHASSAVTIEGLHPRIGLFHVGRGDHHALASDLQEPYRHLAEGFVVSTIRRHEIKPEDFAQSSDGRYPCLMSLDARRRFLVRFEERLLEEFSASGDDENRMTYLDHIARCARSYRAFVMAEVAAPEVLRVHA